MVLHVARWTIGEIEVVSQLRKCATLGLAGLLDHGSRLWVDHAADDRHAGLDDPGFLPRDPLQRVAQLLGVVETKGDRVVRFDVVALGDFWGEGTYTRGAPRGKFPLAVSFTLVSSR